MKEIWFWATALWLLYLLGGTFALQVFGNMAKVLLAVLLLVNAGLKAREMVLAFWN